MIGIIIYEAADILFHVGKIGYNCIEYGLSIIYGKQEESREHNNEYVELYIKRIEELEERLKKLEEDKLNAIADEFDKNIDT
jgi:hypothetical protein